MDVTKELNIVLPLIRQKFKVRRIGLFGSYSDGSQTIDSDIDILVEFDDVTFDNYMGLYLFMKDHFNKNIDLVTTTGINKRLEPIIMKQVIWIAT